MRIAAEIVLTGEQKSGLERFARGRRTEDRLVLRARIVLLAADGHTDLEIAERLGIATDILTDILEKVKRGKAALLNCPSV